MNVLETGIYSALSGNAALTTALGGSYIYNQVAPQNQALPFVTFQHSGGGQENLNPSDLQNHVYLVKALSDNLSTAGDLDDKIRTALHGATLTVSGYTNFYTARETEIRLAETTRAGKIVYHAGAYYRIRLDA